ncbi:unnamed protein product, partial [marine sediment metagenome]
SYPGADFVAADPIGPGECCLYSTTAELAGILGSLGVPYILRMGKLWWDGEAAALQNLCFGPAPAPTGMGNTDVEDGVVNAVSNDDFGVEEGKVWLADSSNWDSAVVKVEQTIDVWVDSEIDFTAVQGGLPASPPAAYLFVENACGRRNAVGFEVAIIEGP